MMKRGAAALLLVAFVNTYAFGGIVGFNPGDKIEVDRGETFMIDLSVASAEVEMNFESVDAIVGTDGGITLDSFDWAAFEDRFFDSIVPDTDFYDSGIKFGYFGSPQSPGLVLGTLTATAPDVVGTYEIMVDSERDGGRSGLGATAEPLFGSVVVNVIPEPATCSLLALGALGLIRRRKA